MLASELHRSADPEVVADRERGERPLAQYNAFSGEATNDCTALLREPLGGIGVGTVIKPIFACDYVCNVRFGRNAFVNCHGVFLGCAPIAIGDDVQIGPAVHLHTAQHPLEGAHRSGLECARPIRIGRDAWIGGGAIVLAGVTVGDGSVVGAGGVVVRDAPGPRRAYPGREHGALNIDPVWSDRVEDGNAASFARHDRVASVSPRPAHARQALNTGSAVGEKKRRKNGTRAVRKAIGRGAPRSLGLRSNAGGKPRPTSDGRNPALGHQSRRCFAG